MRSAISRVVNAVSSDTSDADTERSQPTENSPSDDFIPDEEMVRRRLAESEGYMWQSNIATALDWSTPKTSRVLSTMEGDRSISRCRIGRQKIVCLPGREPSYIQPSGQREPGRENAFVSEPGED